MILAEFNLYFSYSQFAVYDKSVSLPGCDWTDTHVRQGFARRSSTVCFATILEFGDAVTRVHTAHYIENQDDERVVSVPFYSPTGEIVVQGLEDDEHSDDRVVLIKPAHYNLVAAQRVVDEEEEVIELYFQRLDEPAKISKVLVADEELDPPSELLEDAEVA